MKKSHFLGAVCASVFAFVISTSALALTVGPIPYLSQSDSPFIGQPGSPFTVSDLGVKFYLEDFEDSVFTPGWVVNTSTLLCNQFNCFADSVDADDGVVDGSGSLGTSLCFGPACSGSAVSITIIFDPNVLGGYPTHIGVVWTDGSNFGGIAGPFDIMFEWLDESGNSLDILTVSNPGDGSYSGETAEDFFTGIINAGGISALKITGLGSLNYIEIDHLQYGIRHEFLRMPLGIKCNGTPCTAYNAEVISVLDHSVPSGYYCNTSTCDGIVRAFNGEEGLIGFGQNAFPPGYRKDDSGTPFLQGVINYTGANANAPCLDGAFNPVACSPGSSYLNYDGHPGYDYRCTEGVDKIFAAADGTLSIPTTDPINGNPTGFNTFRITHSNGYETWYLHAQAGSVIAPGQVSAGDPIAKCGSEGTGGSHLHFEVRTGSSTVVDPYELGLWTSMVDRLADLVIDFGGIGLWSWMNDASWQKLNNASPTQTVTGDMDGNGEDDVIAVFGNGIFVKRNQGAWAQLHNFIPKALAVGDLDNNGQDDVVIDFGAIGLWARMNDSGWLKLNNSSPTQIAVGDVDANGEEDVIAVFGSGIFVKRNQGGWVQLHGFLPDAITVGDLDGNGKDDVVIDFGGIGLWARMNDSSWIKLHNNSPDLITTGDLDGDGCDDVIATFGGNGLWQKLNLSGWSQLNPNAPDEVITADVDGNGEEDVVASFGSTLGGIYIKRNQGAWSKLHNSSPDSMAVGQLDGN